MKKAHYFQHVSYEAPQNILTWLYNNNYKVNSTLFYKENYVFPLIQDVDVLIVMGGPMGVNDENIYPWLKSELNFIRDFIDSGKKIIGVCLGAQFIAKALGSDVYRNSKKEIGWSDIEFSFFGDVINQKVLHWHGDTFNIPIGCKRIATNEITENQGFMSNNILAFQFHIEMTKVGVEDIIKNSENELNQGGKFVDSVNKILNEENFKGNKKLLFKVLDKFI